MRLVLLEIVRILESDTDIEQQNQRANTNINLHGINSDCVELIMSSCLFIVCYHGTMIDTGLWKYVFAVHDIRWCIVNIKGCKDYESTIKHCGFKLIVL